MQETKTMKPRGYAQGWGAGGYRDEAKAKFTLKALQSKGDYLTYEQNHSTRKEGKMAFEPQRQIAGGLGKDWDWKGTWSSLDTHQGDAGTSTGKGYKS